MSAAGDYIIVHSPGRQLKGEIVMICSKASFEQKAARRADQARLPPLEYPAYRQNNLVLNTWFRQLFGKTPHTLPWCRPSTMSMSGLLLVSSIISASGA